VNAEIQSTLAKLEMMRIGFKTFLDGVGCTSAIHRLHRIDWSSTPHGDVIEAAEAQEVRGSKSVRFEKKLVWSCTKLCAFPRRMGRHGALTLLH